MSRAVLNAILNAMQIWLNETEREQLYHELTAYFGLIGAADECQALEAAWQDPYNRREINILSKPGFQGKGNEKKKSYKE